MQDKVTIGHFTLIEFPKGMRGLGLWSGLVDLNLPVQITASYNLYGVTIQKWVACIGNSHGLSVTCPM